MLFQNIPGLFDVKKNLIETVQKNRVSHAQLFIGIEESCALPMAIAYAQYISCKQPNDTDSCGLCTNCKQFEAYNYPDLHFSYPVASNGSAGTKPKSKDFLKEWSAFLTETKGLFTLHNWLSYINLEKKQAIISVHESVEVLRTLALKSYSGGHKFQLVYCADRLNTTAANKLLKLIEEPEDKTTLILITEKPEQILTTIDSRCQKTFIGKVDNESIVTYLTTQLNINLAEARTAAHFSQGSVLKALDLTRNQDELIAQATLFANWMRACFAAKVDLINLCLEPILSMDRDSQKEFLSMVAKIVEERLLANYQNQRDNPIFKGITFNEKKFSALLNPFNSALILDLLNQASYDISRNGNAKIILLDTSLKLSNALKTKIPATVS